MKTSLARIFVQNPFCKDCITPIKKRIAKEVENIKNITLYPSDSLVVFNFNQVNQVSEVLNTLMALGHPQKGDKVDNHTHMKPLCTCKIHTSNDERKYE